MNYSNVFYLYKPSQLCVGGVVCNEEPQTVIRDLHWSRSVHFYTRKGLLIKKRYCASKNGLTDRVFQSEIVLIV